MRTDFSLFQSHLDLAQQFWKKIVYPGDNIIDATSGNGQDALFLARLLNGKGSLHVYDIQDAALKKTRTLLEEQLSADEYSVVEFFLSSHTEFQENDVKLIVYNLGYLPGGDKSITTVSETSLKSVQNAMDRLSPGGAISITCYPGHKEGEREETALAEWAATLLPKMWSVSHHRWINRSLSPSLLLLQKKVSSP